MSSLWKTHFQLPEGELSVIVPTTRGGSVTYRLEGALIPNDSNERRGPVTVPSDRWENFVGLLFCSLFEVPGHPFTPSSEGAIDSEALFQFSVRMGRKLAKKREDGRGGWYNPAECEPSRLAEMLLDHLAKGDPVDIANFAMMLGQRGDARGTLTEVFPKWLEKQVRSSDLFTEMSQTANFHSSRVDEEHDKRIKAEVLRERIEKECTQKLKEADAAVAAAEATAQRLERNLARALGYIDRVNEGRVQPAPQLTTLGPELEAEAVPGAGLDPYWRSRG